MSLESPLNGPSGSAYLISAKLVNISTFFFLFFYRAPYLVVLKDRGKTLRFYRPRNLRLQEDALREFLKTDGWKATPPWLSSYAPGGSK
jgi:hypothetical protein